MPCKTVMNGMKRRPFRGKSFSRLQKQVSCKVTLSLILAIVGHIDAKYCKVEMPGGVPPEKYFCRV